MQGQDSPQAVDVNQYSFDFSQEPSARCGSCGGPSTAPEGDLCDTCQQAFSSLLNNAAALESVEVAPVEHVPTVEFVPPVEFTAALEQLASVEPVAVAEPVAPVAPVAPVVHAAVVEPVSPVAPAPVSEAAVLAAAVAPAPEAQSRSAAAAEAFADAMSAAVTAPVATVEADPQPVKPVENNVAAAAAAPVRKLRAEVVAAAAVLVVAVVGVPTGALWLQRQVAARNAAALMQEQPAPAPVARALPAPKPQAQPDPAPAAVVPEPTPLPPAPVAAAPRPAAAPVRAARTVKTPSKVDKLPAPTSQPAAPAAASTPLPAAPAAVVAAPVPAVQPQVVAVPETPAGKLFEPNEVDVTPRIASRVDPQLPGNLTGRPGNDVVVVRILVSQSGHPFRVNLLRRSRLGPSVDEAVLSAVKQWTFTPARKRGEVVSCWFNVGVSLTAN